MTSENVLLPQDKTIVGISVRTRPETAGQDIAVLWGRFMQEDIVNQLGAVNPTVYSVYCDYETDHQGAYTTVLGCEVPPTAPILSGMRRVVIPVGSYARFSVQGDPGKVVWEAWVSINGTWTTSHLRSYTADFERYTLLSPSQVEAEIYVGLHG